MSTMSYKLLTEVVFVKAASRALFAALVAWSFASCGEPVPETQFAGQAEQKQTTDAPSALVGEAEQVHVVGSRSGIPQEEGEGNGPEGTTSEANSVTERPSGEGSSPNPPNEALQKPPVMERSVVGVYTARGRGTGFVVRSHNGELLIATAAHVVDNGQHVSVITEVPTTADGSGKLKVSYPDVEVVAADFERDLALLRIRHLRGDELVPLELGTDECTSAVKAWGYPPTIFNWRKRLGLTAVDIYSVSPNSLDFVEWFGPANVVRKSAWATGLVFQPKLEGGNSGGPLVNKKGQVVAVLVMGSLIHEQGAAVCAKHLEELLDTASTGPTVPTRKEVKEMLSHIVRNVLPFTARLKDAPPVFSWLPPDTVQSIRDFYLEDILQKSAMLELLGSSGGGSDGSGAGSYLGSAVRQARVLRLAIEDVFPGLKTFLPQEKGLCQAGKDVDLECVASLAVVPVASAMVESQVGKPSRISGIEVTSDPALTDPERNLYEVTIDVVENGQHNSKRVRLRHAFGRFWLDPGSPSEYFEDQLSEFRMKERMTRWRAANRRWGCAWEQRTMDNGGNASNAMGVLLLSLTPGPEEEQKVKVSVFYTYLDILDSGKFECSNARSRQDIFVWTFSGVPVGHVLIGSIDQMGSKQCEPSGYVPTSFRLALPGDESLADPTKGQLTVYYSDGHKADFAVTVQEDQLTGASNDLQKLYSSLRKTAEGLAL